MVILILYLCSILLFCFPEYRYDINSPSGALKLVRINYPIFYDDLDYKGLDTAIERNMKFLTRLDPDLKFRYGMERISVKHVISTQKSLLEFIKKRPTVDELNKFIMDNFKVYKAAGIDGSGRVLFTGYFEPLFLASPKKDKVYKYPIYKRPKDLVVIDLSPFGKRFKGQRIIARIKGKKVLPYYSREQIEIKGVLKGRKLEIAYLKSFIDVLFLQIQGSGKLRFPDGRVINVGYSISNGRPYRSIGRYLIEKGYVTRDQLSMHKIREFLEKHPELWPQLCRYNPSYVFFSVRKDGPFGNIKVLLTPQRSIATDYRLFPKGALAFIRTKKPILDKNGNVVGWKKFCRFVMNQDTGGAIRGAGRVDIYFGTGERAGIMAGSMKQIGDMYILIKKSPYEKELALIRKLREICYFLKKRLHILNQSYPVSP